MFRSLCHISLPQHCSPLCFIKHVQKWIRELTLKNQPYVYSGESFQRVLDEMVSELNIIQAICGGRLGMSGQLEGLSVFLLVPVGFLKSLFWALVPLNVNVFQETASTQYRLHNTKHICHSDGRLWPVKRTDMSHMPAWIHLLDLKIDNNDCQ